MTLEQRVLERVHRFGPLPFDEYLALALYDPDDGFFTGGGGGAGRDFLTSPEVGGLFGAVLARALDEWWGELGRPDPFVVAEVGAGPGTLAKAVLGAAPSCAPALRYLLVETSPLLRDRQAAVLPLEPASMLLGPRSEADDDDADAVPAPGTGPLVASLAELPAERFCGVILANELLDNLPWLLLERTADGWCEVRVGEQDGTLSEVLVPASDALCALADALAPAAGSGARIPVQRAARDWIHEALGLLTRGRVVAIDYATTTADLARRPWTEWLRTYRRHGRGGHPLDRPGSQDVTCEVAIDQLPAPQHDRSQSEFLRAHGIDELVAEARAAWQSAAAAPDLAALAARSRIGEADALLDDSGLGAFRVLEWRVG